MSVDAKKIAALELSLKAKTEQLSALHKQMDAAREAIASLESERAANAILTAEIEALRAQQRQDCEPWGWAIVDKNGDDVKKRVRQINFFGAVNHQQEPLTQEDVTQADRDWPGLAPCRLVTLYAAPPKREPLSREKVRHLMSVAGYVDATQQEKADFINGVRFAEREHGIGGQS